MSARPALQHHSAAVWPSAARRMPARHASSLNRILAGLPREDSERLLPYLEPMTLSKGSLLHAAGVPVS